MMWVFVFAASALIGGLAGRALGRLQKKALPRLASPMAISLIALFAGYVGLMLGSSIGKYLIEQDPQNAQADGPLVGVAVMLFSCVVGLGSLAGSGAGAYYVSKRTNKR